MDQCIGLIAMLIVLSALGWVIDLIVPGRMPYGWLGGVVAAIVGGIVGGLLFGFIGGPSTQFLDYRLYWIPALLGGILVGLIVRFLMGRTGRTAV